MIRSHLKHTQIYTKLTDAILPPPLGYSEGEPPRLLIENSCAEPRSVCDTSHGAVGPVALLKRTSSTGGSVVTGARRHGHLELRTKQQEPAPSDRTRRARR